MARIAIDARKYFDYGIGSYIQNLASALSEMHTTHEFTMLAASGDLAKIHAPAGWRLDKSDYGKYSFGEIAFLGRDALSAKAELFHEPHYTLPAGLKGRSVVTVHDLIHVKLPQYFSIVQRVYAASMLKHAVNHAGAVIAVSQKTKDDIIETFKIDDARVTVVHNGVRPVFRKLGDKSAIGKFRQSRKLERPFILYVGNVKPHKNIPLLLNAFAEVLVKYRDLDLVFAGGSCLRDGLLATQCAKLGITERIRDLNQLAEPDLVVAYNCAEMVVLPSLYEGFGFPALEAMACETSVIVSSGGALPEVVGNAAPIVDPASPEHLASAIGELLEDSTKKADWIEKGKERSEEFSWQKTGKQTLSVYESVLERCRQN